MIPRSNLNLKSIIPVLSTVVILCTNTNIGIAKTSKSVPSNDFDFAKELIEAIENNPVVHLPGSEHNAFVATHYRQAFNSKYLDAANKAKLEGQIFKAITYYCALMQISESPDTQNYLNEVKQLLPKSSPLEKSLIPKLLYQSASSRKSAYYHSSRFDSGETNEFKQIKISDTIDILELALNIAQNKPKSNSPSSVLKSIYLLLSDQYEMRNDTNPAIYYIQLVIEADKLDRTSDALFKDQLHLIRLYQSGKDEDSATREIKTLVNFMLNDQFSAFSRLPYFKSAINVCVTYKLREQAAQLYNKQLETALFCLRNLSTASQIERQYIHLAVSPDYQHVTGFSTKREAYDEGLLELDPLNDLRLKQIQFLLNFKTSKNSPLFNRSDFSIQNLNSYLVNCSPDQIIKVKEAVKAYSILDSSNDRFYLNQSTPSSNLNKIATGASYSCANPLIEKNIKLYIQAYESGSAVNIDDLFSKLEIYTNYLIREQKYAEAKSIISKMLEIKEKSKSSKNLDYVNEKIISLNSTTKGKLNLDPATITNLYLSIEKSKNGLNDSQFEDLEGLPDSLSISILTKVIKLREVKHGIKDKQLILPLEVLALNYLHTKDTVNLVSTYKRLLSVAATANGKSSSAYCELAFSIIERLINIGEYKEAKQVIEQFIDGTGTNSSSSEQKTGLADLLMRSAGQYCISKDYSQAIQIAKAAIKDKPISTNFLDELTGSLEPSVAKLISSLEKSNNYKLEEEFISYWSDQVKASGNEADYFHFLQLHLALAYKKDQSKNSTNNQVLADNLYKKVKSYFAKTKGETSPIYRQVVSTYEKSI